MTDDRDHPKGCTLGIRLTRTSSLVTRSPTAYDDPVGLAFVTEGIH
jgi:hypothetical protein